jgi:A/G-specific adenine glycosylase
VRLHASAGLITTQYAGDVPASANELRSLPGVGAYTAAAVSSFAFGERHAVLDTNVRRVLARLVTGAARPAPAPTAAERQLAERLLPPGGRQAAQWSVGVMELGALVCTAVRPRCSHCPLAEQCAWVQHGQPAAPARRAAPGYHGSDRHCRGQLLAVLRAASGPVPAHALAAAWQNAEQRSRALGGLIDDGIVTPREDDSFALLGDGS